MQLSAPDNYLSKNQAWQDVKASRVAEVTYTNTTGKPIFISINLDLQSSHYVIFKVDGVRHVISGASFSQFRVVVSHIVQPGSTYGLFSTSGMSISDWMELR